MRFILDANVPRRAAIAIRDLGHECLDVRDLLARGAVDAQVAAYAKTHSLSLVSRDFDFADVRNYPPEQYAGIVVLDLPEDVHADFIVVLLVAFVKNQPILDRLPGRLAVVAPGRIRLRPA
jgi:predicted nuclease of predicted toxin-antitoxin system